jgi:hypothetical protein
LDSWVVDDEHLVKRAFRAKSGHRDSTLKSGERTEAEGIVFEVAT